MVTALAQESQRAVEQQQEVDSGVNTGDGTGFDKTAAQKALQPNPGGNPAQDPAKSGEIKIPFKNDALGAFEPLTVDPKQDPTLYKLLSNPDISIEATILENGKKGFTISYQGAHSMNLVAGPGQDWKKVVSEGFKQLSTKIAGGATPDTALSRNEMVRELQKLQMEKAVSDTALDQALKLAPMLSRARPGDTARIVSAWSDRSNAEMQRQEQIADREVIRNNQVLVRQRDAWQKRVDAQAVGLQRLVSTGKAWQQQIAGYIGIQTGPNDVFEQVEYGLENATIDRPVKEKLDLAVKFTQRDLAAETAQIVNGRGQKTKSPTAAAPAAPAPDSYAGLSDEQLAERLATLRNDIATTNQRIEQTAATMNLSETDRMGFNRTLEKIRETAVRIEEKRAASMEVDPQQIEDLKALSGRYDSAFAYVRRQFAQDYRTANDAARVYLAWRKQHNITDPLRRQAEGEIIKKGQDIIHDIFN